MRLEAAERNENAQMSADDRGGERVLADGKENHKGGGLES